MNRDILAAFLQAGKQVLGGMIGQVEVDKDSVSGGMRNELLTSDEISVLVSISGQLHGVVIFGMSTASAMKIAASMMGMEQPHFDAMVASAVSELGNMISGHALAGLSKVGYECALSTPKLRRGAGIVKVPTAAVTIPYHTDHGKLNMRISLLA